MTYQAAPPCWEIHPDASGYGIGAVLVQKIDGKDSPLAFLSRLLKGSELKYSRKKRTYYQHALCCLLSKKDLAGRLARWATVIQGDHLRIVHKSGRLHSDSDDLSRYPVPCGEEKVNEFNDNYLPLFNITPTEVIKLTQEVPTELKAAQQEDPEFQEIYQLFQDQPPKNKKTRNFV